MTCCVRSVVIDTLPMHLLPPFIPQFLSHPSFRMAMQPFSENRTDRRKKKQQNKSFSELRSSNFTNFLIRFPFRHTAHCVCFPSRTAEYWITTKEHTIKLFCFLSVFGQFVAFRLSVDYFKFFVLLSLSLFFVLFVFFIG